MFSSLSPLHDCHPVSALSQSPPILVLFLACVMYTPTPSRYSPPNTINDVFIHQKEHSNLRLSWQGKGQQGQTAPRGLCTGLIPSWGFQGEVPVTCLHRGPSRG